MRIERHTDVAAYERLVRPAFLRDEPRFNLELAILARVARGETYGYGPPLLLTVGDGATLMTPPHNLLVSGVPVGAATELAEYVLAHGIEVPGVMGAPETAYAFAERYAARTGATYRTARHSGVYALTKLVPPRPAPGALRQATLDDLGVVATWLDAFQAEVSAVRPGPGEDERRLRDGMYWIWDDSGPVSLCGIAGYTPNGARIGPVYTPREHRGRGYASAATAGVTELLLARGLAQTFLYTDLANPTSNKIYQAIGYEHVTDVHEVVFDR